MPARCSSDDAVGAGMQRKRKPRKLGPYTLLSQRATEHSERATALSYVGQHRYDTCCHPQIPDLRMPSSAPDFFPASEVCEIRGALHRSPDLRCTVRVARVVWRICMHSCVVGRWPVRACGSGLKKRFGTGVSRAQSCARCTSAWRVFCYPTLLRNGRGVNLHSIRPTLK